MDPEAHVQEMAKEHEGGSVTVTGKESACGHGWTVTDHV